MAIIESKAQDDKTRMYRRVFGTGDGKKVLAHMLVELNVFSSIPPKDEERMALRNYGLSLLYNMGVLIDKNIDTIVDKFMSIDYNVKIEDKE